MKNLAKLIAVLAVAVSVSLTTGCAVNRASATVDPDAKLDGIKTVHVLKFDKDEHHTDAVIVDKLRARGYTVTTGAKPAGPVDAVVTYVDKWFWDITTYMLELTIVVREPKTDYPLASGNSFHTSMTRKSPPEMVDEVLGNIFKDAKKK